MTKGWMDEPEFRKTVAGNTPIGRPAKPEEIAEMVVFISSSGATFATGHTFVVDGTNRT